jgi:hypothetical protein
MTTKPDGDTMAWTYLGMPAPDLSHVSAQDLDVFEAAVNKFLDSGDTCAIKNGYCKGVITHVRNARRLPQGEEQQSEARMARGYDGFLKRAT